MATIEIVGGIKDQFTLIPNDVFRDPKITPVAVKVYGFLRSQGGGHTVQNVVHICSTCHYWLHMHPAIAYTNGWLVKSTRDPECEPFLRRGGAVFLFEDGEMEGYFEPESADMGDGAGPG